MKFYNTNDLFGHSDPIEAKTKNEAADLMMENINIWAYEEFDDTIGPMCDDEYNDWMDGRSNDQVIDEIAKRMRAEFIDGLTTKGEKHE